MIVKDFIRHVADGAYCKDDILNYAKDSWDIKELIWDMKLADIVVEDKLGHPLITDDKEINRVDAAISLISKEFGVSLLDDDSSTRYKDDGVSTLNKPACKCILPDELIDKAINAGLIERTENVLKWIKSASLYGYFIDKVSDKLNLKSSSGRIQWKKFCFIDNHKTLLSTARQAVNDYTNKDANPPEGDDIVNELLK